VRIYWQEKVEGVSHFIFSWNEVSIPEVSKQEKMEAGRTLWARPASVGISWE
jgi:hypothetical protein